MATVATISVNFAQYDSVSFTPTGVVDRSINPKTLSQYCLGTSSGDFSYTGGFVKKTGDTMSGYLTLDSVDPTLPDHAARKAYVDSRIFSLSSTVNNSDFGFVRLSGSTMTGALILNTNTPTTSLQSASKGYVDSRLTSLSSTVDSTLSVEYLKTSGGNMRGNILMNSNKITGLPVIASAFTDSDAVSKKYVDDVAAAAGSSGSSTTIIYVDEQITTRVAKAGDTMTGFLTLNGNPTQNLHAATKQYVDGSIAALSLGTSKAYVDSQDATRVAKSGDSMTGFLTLNGNPTQNLHAATKQYVDAAVAAGGGAAGSTFVSKAGDTMTGFLTLNGNPTQNLHAATKAYVDSIAGSATITASRVAVSNSSGTIVASSITSAQLDTLAGINTNVQSQLNGKQNIIGGAASTVTSSNLTPNKILISDSNGKIAASSVESTWIDTFVRENSRVPEKFANAENRCGTASYFVSSHFISKDGRLYSSGYSNGLRFGIDTWANTLQDGFVETTPDTRFGFKGNWVWQGDEYVTDVYPAAYSIYVRTNRKRLFCTGYGGYGQLGVGALVSGYDRYYTWDLVPLSNVDWFSVANGVSSAQHCCAISNGKLYTWGYNGHYQLGDGTNTNRFSPTLINNGSITNLNLKKAYACGDDYTSYAYTFVIDQNDDLHFVGNNGGGQAGNGNQVQQTNFIKIGIKANTVLSKSWNSDGTTYVLYNNSLYTCGGNHYGMLGDGTKTRRTTFAKVLDGVVEMSSCGYHNGTIIARMSNGTVRTWGRNTQGVCGNGNQTDVTTPYNPGINNVVKVLAFGGSDYGSIAALLSDGQVSAWGYNGYGNIGLGGESISTTPKTIRFNYNKARFVDLDFWSNYGGAGNGLLLKASNGDLYATGYCNWGCGGLYTTDYGDWIRNIQRSEIK